MGTAVTDIGNHASTAQAEGMPVPPSLLVCHFLAALVCGAIIVVAPFELLFLIVPAWLIVVGSVANDWRRQNQRSAAAAILLIQLVTVFAVVLAAANYAPAKTRETMQDELSATLPQSTMSLAEIRAFVEEQGNRAGFLRLVHFTDQETGLQAKVTFPDRHVTLRQFITEINRQTPFEARLIGGCGNGSTILHGVAPYYVVLTQR